MADIGQGCGVQQLRVVPHDHVAGAVVVGMQVLRLRGMALELVEQRDGLFVGHAFDAE